jgi:Zn-dependent M28 family amino/carboxypeptidase
MRPDKGSGDDEASITALQARLMAHLQELVRERDPGCAPAGHSYVKDYLGRELERYGKLMLHAFDHLGRTHENLVLDLPGQHDRGFLLIGAHYDAVPGSPGADDNGTALAVLLELARAFSIAPARRPIRLVAFDLEESNRSGSRAYAETLLRRGEPLALMISLEMLGYRDPRPGSQRYPPGLSYLYPDRGDFIGLIGNLRTVPVLRRLARTMREVVPCEFLPVPFRGRLLPDTRRSDHASFWDLGYPALMITDTANMRNPHYHRASDRIETLDIRFLAGVCRGIIKGLSTL